VRAVRVIPCLDVTGGRVVKGVKFVDLKDAGDPVELAARYDAVITLAAPGAAPIGLGSTGNPIFNVPASLLGIPALSLPLLSAEGLPLGLQLAGFAGEDARLFAIAAAVSDLLGVASRGAGAA